MKWEPIETAPKAYNPVLLRQDETVGEGCYATHIRTWEFFNPGLVMRRNPTHWMPLPEPPNAALSGWHGKDETETEK